MRTSDQFGPICLLQHATPTCNGNVSRTTGNSRDYSLLCFWIFCIAIPCTYGVKDPWENQHNLDQLLHAKIFNHHLFLVIVSFGWIYAHAVLLRSRQSEACIPVLTNVHLRFQFFSRYLGSFHENTIRIDQNCYFKVHEVEMPRLENRLSITVDFC